VPRLEVFAPDGIGEVAHGTDLAALAAPYLRDGDVLVVTSKGVSKAEGRVVAIDREQAIRDETVRIVARRGATSIVETRLGVVMAAAGVDASNVAPGSVVLLPVDPDASARRLRERLAETADINVAVVVSDTAGRAWRHGQTDLALGVAGMQALESFD
jgi:coenzyme F420-0:L-glutamate ligase/coenzyme F420-1:gamma-L-glutamate ligase